MFRSGRATVRQVCSALYGRSSDACFMPELRAGWESAPMLNPDVCDLSSDPVRCRADLFGGI